MEHQPQEIHFKLNGESRVIKVSPNKPLLWVLREDCQLTGTKYGCGLSTCGVCTVHLNGEATRSCVLPISACHNQEITTIEGLSHQGTHPVQQAWIDCNVPQCGYCQSGQLMQASSLLNHTPSPSLEKIRENMSRVVCRCGTYPRIKRAILKASQNILRMKQEP